MLKKPQVAHVTVAECWVSSESVLLDFIDEIEDDIIDVAFQDTGACMRLRQCE